MRGFVQVSRSPIERRRRSKTISLGITAPTAGDPRIGPDAIFHRFHRQTSYRHPGGTDLVLSCANLGLDDRVIAYDPEIKLPRNQSS